MRQADLEAAVMKAEGTGSPRLAPKGRNGRPAGSEWAEGGSSVYQNAAEPRISGDESAGYAYTTTRVESAADIADSGKLNVWRPQDSEVWSDQSSWPDGSTKRRSYWSSSEARTIPFSRPGEKNTVLRVKKDSVPGGIKAESGTGDFYAEKPIPAAALEYLSKDGTWKPLVSISDTTPLRTYPPGKATPEQAAKLREGYRGWMQRETKTKDTPPETELPMPAGNRAAYYRLQNEGGEGYVPDKGPAPAFNIDEQISRLRRIANATSMHDPLYDAYQGEIKSLVGRRLEENGWNEKTTPERRSEWNSWVAGFKSKGKKITPADIAKKESDLGWTMRDLKEAIATVEPKAEP
ncbi:hypothetical protein CCP3SC15_2410001 [Gammaproteobacteria bacterium]